MIKPSFIPPPDIRQLRDLMRYRVKFTNMITGEKNRALNFLMVSNLKLDDVFSDVFGKSSRSIMNYILEHPGETFDVAPFVDKHCKHPIEEIQAAVDGAVSREQAAKRKECLKHIDELNAHKLNIEKEILRLAEPYSVEGYLVDGPTAKTQVLTTQQALNLLKSRGFIIKDALPSGTDSLRFNLIKCRTRLWGLCCYTLFSTHSAIFLFQTFHWHFQLDWCIVFL